MEKITMKKSCFTEE